MPKEADGAVATGFVAALPVMEVVPLRDIRFHEEVDLARVAALIERLGADGVLRNPPIVARFPERQRLLLDGANRIEALSRMGIAHALVQTEDFEDPELQLARWNHVVRAGEAAAILEAPPSGVRVRDAGARNEAAEPGIAPVCRLVRPDGREAVFLAVAEPAARAAALRAIAARCAHPRARLARIAHRDLDQVRLAHPEFGGLLEYAEVTKQGLRATADAGERLPSGITRFVVPRRVLGFDLPLSFLAMNLPLAEKRRRLDALVSERFQSGRVRYYAEPAFVFDD